MRISIEEELLKVQKNEETQQSANIAEIKQLLAGDASEDLRILRALSNDSQFNRIERLHGKKMDLEKMDNKYNGNVFHIDQIEKLALEYRLRFLPSKLFTGQFDVELTAKIKEFSKETKIPIDDYTLNRFFYILAPKEMFLLKDEQYVTKKQLDPLIFYKISDEHYKLIHKWGDDFTIMRYFEGFRWRNLLNYNLFNIAITLPFIGFFYGLLFGPHFLSTFPITSGIIILTFSLIIMKIFNFNKVDDGDVIAGFFSDTAWNSNKNIRN